MKCSNCGTENKEQNLYCSECGTNLSERKDEKKKKKPKKKFFVIITAIIVLIAGLSIFYLIGKSKFTPEDIVQTFEESVKNNDPEEIHSLLTSSDQALSINADTTAVLVEYLKENPESFEELINKLNDQSKELESGDTAYITDEIYGTLDLIKSGKRWLLFDDYKLEITPVYIKLITENKEIDLSINDENVALSGENYEETFGPFMPGTHVVKGSYQNEYTSTEITDEINIFETSEEAFRHEVELPLAEVSIKSLYDEYQLFINGEKADIVINEGENPIGIFPQDSSTTVHIQKEFPWGIVKSEEKTISSERVEFGEIDVLAEDEQLALMEQINETISLYHKALTNRDESILQSGITNNLKELLQEHLEFTGDWDPAYEGELTKTLYDKSKIGYPEYDESLEGFTITLRAHYLLYEPQGHAYGNLSWLGRDLDKQQYKASKGLTLFYDKSESAWKLHNIEDEFFHLSERNKQEFTIEN